MTYCFSARTCSGAATVGSQETVEHTLALPSALLSYKHHHTPAASPRLFRSPGELKGLHPTSLVAGLGDVPGQCRKISGGKQVNSCYLELSRVSASRGRQSLWLPIPPVLPQPNPEAEGLPPQATPPHIHTSQKSCPLELNSHRQIKCLGPSAPA